MRQVIALSCVIILAVFIVSDSYSAPVSSSDAHHEDPSKALKGPLEPVPMPERDWPALPVALMLGGAAVGLAAAVWLRKQIKDSSETTGPLPDLPKLLDDADASDSAECFYEALMWSMRDALSRKYGVTAWAMTSQEMKELGVPGEICHRAERTLYAGAEPPVDLRKRDLDAARSFLEDSAGEL
ncbi:MAG: hypothetical protein ACLFWL_12795 [Candidatus Brocadiia bacterium]